MLYPNMFGGMRVIENPNCMQKYQLTDFTKELMGEEWVKQFDRWAEHALPRQPACYRMGDTLIIHPAMADQIRRHGLSASSGANQTKEAE